MPLGGGDAPAGGPLREEVTFVAPMRVLFWKRWARTTMRQAVHSAPGSVDVAFQLLRSVRGGANQNHWRETSGRHEAAKPACAFAPAECGN